MNIIISNQGGKPIYDQIAEQIRAMVMDGRLKEGDMLPSLRLLAKELKVSVITTRRAYDELEQAGFVVQVAGKGCFVAAPNTALLLENRRREIERCIAEAVDLAKGAGIDSDELRQMLEILLDT
ncbi:MAG: GntR family transcriptional regulator [Sphaerochaetaceae bacterium]|nr:GntR family transcriptional regulator [Sphaerochaetaceae bacterium]